MCFITSGQRGVILIANPLFIAKNYGGNGEATIL